MSNKKHRGWIQAQGGGFEDSVSWSQDKPLSRKDGLSLLERLRLKIPNKERKIRAQQFEDAKRYIENVSGGIDAVKKKTFLNRRTKDVRVDIEVLGGTAFVSILVMLIILLKYLL